MKRDRLVDIINRRLDLPMALLSLLMLALILVDIAAIVPPETRVLLERTSWGIWAAFALEFLVKLTLAESPRQYMKDHWFDALVLLVPMFRVLRAFRVMRLAWAFPLFRLAAFIGTALRGAVSFFIRYQLGYLLVVTVMVAVGCAAGVFLLERNVPDTRFLTMGDALWWSAALMTTVASDLNPQTAWGRFIAVCEMVYSMTVFVYLMGAVSSNLLKERRPEPPKPTVRQGVREMEGRPSSRRESRLKPPSRTL